MSDELKPCPFCGGEASLREEHDNAWVLCPKCQISLEGFEDCEAAIATWNTRAQAPAAPQLSVMDDPKVVERVAAALWKAQVVDAGSPKSVIDRRTPEAFAESGDDARGKWLKMARAALAALSEPTP